MLVMGHAGITLGTAVLLGRVLLGGPSSFSQPTSPTDRERPPWVSRIDLRFLVLGSLLPDIIDKPIGLVIFRDTFSSGRIFSHTLLFLSLMALAGFWLFRRRAKTWLLVLSFGTCIHLILDQMWLERRTLLWPLYGLEFGRIDVTQVVHHWFDGLLTDPAVYVPEIVGAGILLWFLLLLVRRRSVYDFVRKGRIARTC